MLFFNKNAKLLKKAQIEIEKLKEQNRELAYTYAPLIDNDKILNERQNEIQNAENKLRELNDKYQLALKVHENLEHEISLYNDSLEIGSFGLYKPQYSFETSEKFKTAIDNNYDRQKQLIKSDQAVICTTEWTVSGSKVEGRKMTNQYKKLMLYAFNGECDGLIAKVKWNNATSFPFSLPHLFPQRNRYQTNP